MYRLVKHKLVRSVLFLALAPFVVSGLLLMAIVWDMNDKIDRCFDDYSPSYIQDQAHREKACQEMKI